MIRITVSYFPHDRHIVFHRTYVGSETEKVHSEFIAHAVVTFIVGKLNKRDHLLKRSKGFDALFIIPSFCNGLADLFESSWMQNKENKE